MKKKVPFYKNGILIGLLMAVGGFLIAGINVEIGAYTFWIGAVVFCVSLIVRIIRWIKGLFSRRPSEAARVVENVVITPLMDPEKPPVQPAPQTPNSVVEAVPAPQPSKPVVDNASVPQTQKPVVEDVPVPKTPSPLVEDAPAPQTPAPSNPEPPEPQRPQMTDDKGDPSASQDFTKLSIPAFIDIAKRAGYVALDFETTGFNPKMDRITEIGAIKVGASGDEVERYTTLVNPKRHIPSNVSARTNITDAMVRNAPAIEDVLPDLFRFIGSLPFIAYNAGFDKSFLEHAASSAGVGCDLQYADALTWARQTYTLQTYKQGDVAAHIGHVPDIEHRAVADCETLAAIVTDMLKRESDDIVEPEDVHVVDDVHAAEDARCQENALNATEYEMTIANHFIAVIRECKPEANPVLVRRSNAYLSLCEGANDFLRIKYSNHARWLSIDSYGAELDDDNPLFAAQKNKRQRHWKARINDTSDIVRFDDYVVKACRSQEE